MKIISKNKPLKLPKPKKLNFSLRQLLVDFALIFIIIFISYNVLLAYNRGTENQRMLKIEEEKLIELQKQNEDLSAKENYYKSIEYRKAYARETLNLTSEGERLYYVLREEDLEKDTIKLFESEAIGNLEYWKMLIFGD